MITAQSITRRVRFHCPDSACAAALAFIGADPLMERQPLEDIEYFIESAGDGFYRFAGPGASMAGWAGEMVENGHRMLQKLLVDETQTSPLLHGGSVLIDGRRFILVARKGVGKTTLLLKCLAQGHAVEADEHVVLLAADEVMARPRTLRVKSRSADIVPELRDRIFNSPMVRDWDGNAIYSVAPETQSSRWRIAPGPVDYLIFLEANHGGLTGLRRLGREHSFSRMLDNVFLPAAERGASLALLHCIASATPSWQMRVGDLDSALWRLQQIAALC